MRKHSTILYVGLYFAVAALGIFVFYKCIDLGMQRFFPEIETEKYSEESVEIATEEAVVFEPITEPETEAEIEITETEAKIETDTEATTETVPESRAAIQPSICAVAESADQGNRQECVVTDDLMLLARLIQSEAGADICTDEHQRAVASVLMNHVASPYFPNTIYGCIFVGWVDGGIKNYGIGSVEKFYSLVPSERAIANAQYVLTYGSTVGDAIYQAEFIQGEVVAVFSYPGTGYATTYICR